MKSESACEVLCLHRVSQEEGEPGPYKDMTISPSVLEDYINANPGRFGMKWPEILKGRGKRKRALLTFDDGYKETLYTVLPILERNAVPAIVFITVAFSEGSLEPFSVYAARIFQPLTKAAIGKHLLTMDNIEQRHNAIGKAYRLMDRGGARKRTRALVKLARENGVPVPETRSDVFLNWKELRKLSRHPLITIGAHSWTHPRLSRIPPWGLKRELYDARLYLESKLYRPVRILAYPHGAHNGIVRWAARTAGYRFAFTTENRNLTPGDSINAMRIPRIDFNYKIDSPPQ
jgi:peptidoglycan/xylan/chitin deacetylase (PgdA/CDA1 family)